MLSGGERRRVEIARSLVIDPEFPAARRTVLRHRPHSGARAAKDHLRSQAQSGIGILITDHNVRETLAVTDRAYIINDGKIFRTGTPDQLGNDPEVRRIYLGENFNLELAAGRWNAPAIPRP